MTPAHVTVVLALLSVVHPCAAGAVVILYGCINPTVAEFGRGVAAALAGVAVGQLLPVLQPVAALGAVVVTAMQALHTKQAFSPPQQRPVTPPQVKPISIINLV